MNEPLAKLLVVDDNEDNRDLLARRLERRGYAVDVAVDGSSALAAIERGGYDLVLLDVMMPGISGVEVLAEVRARRSKAELPVLMATAKSDSEDIVAALAMGANDYVTKPLDFPVVLARIESHLQMRAEVARYRAPVLALDGSVAKGTVLDGRYEVLEVIGEGGFAVVFKARQISTGQVVALKLLRAHRIAAIEGAGVERKRFEREMKLIGQLRHPHVVRLVDSGSIEVERARSGLLGRESLVTPPAPGEFPRTRAEGPDPEPTGGDAGTVSVPYLVMEYLDGRPLAAILRERGVLAPSEAVDLLLPVLSAVAAAHNAGVVHRDLKPPNIMVIEGPSGAPHPKVLDFGVAKPREEGTTGLTRDAGFVGTPEYMSPEQAKGASEATPMADQYALGLMLYECITGRRPFEGESFIELVHRIATGSFERPSSYVPHLPEALERAILRAMHVEPARRFRSLTSFGAALLPFASPEVAAQWSVAFARTDISEPPPELVAPRATGAETVSLVMPPPPAPRASGRATRLGLLAAAAVVALAVWAVSAFSSAGRYRVVLRVHPGSAEIFLDGRPVGRGALRRELPRDGARHTIRVTAPGYVPETLTFADAPPQGVLELEALPGTPPFGAMPTAAP